MTASTFPYDAEAFAYYDGPPEQTSDAENPGKNMFFLSYI
jgi:hypothetical protein